jgi:hypothetical protein
MQVIQPCYRGPDHAAERGVVSKPTRLVSENLTLGTRSCDDLQNHLESFKGQGLRKRVSRVCSNKSLYTSIWQSNVSRLLVINAEPIGYSLLAFVPLPPKQIYATSLPNSMLNAVDDYYIPEESIICNAERELEGKRVSKQGS